MKQDFVSGRHGRGTGRVTVRAIAAETGLSIATVSRVLNGGGNVASATRERVRQVVEQLGDGLRTGAPETTGSAGTSPRWPRLGSWVTRS
jgi:transcriptional regulator with XRE-family HTH domain